MRLMEYKIISGRTVETKRSWFPTGQAARKPRGTRRAGASSVRKIKANEKNRIMNLARTINCNFEAGDCLFTAKYDDRHYPDPDPSLPPEDQREAQFQAAKQNQKKFLQKLRKDYEKETGKKLKAVAVTANWNQKKDIPARLHHHLILPSDATEIAKKLWYRFGGIGTVREDDLNNEGDYTRVASYLFNNVHGRPAGENIWFLNDTATTEIYTEPVEVREVEGVQAEYQSVIKEHYSIRDEDGQAISSYIRCTLPERPKVRGGQIILPKRTRRKTG